MKIKLTPDAAVNGIKPGDVVRMNEEWYIVSSVGGNETSLVIEPYWLVRSVQLLGTIMAAAAGFVAGVLGWW